MPIVPIYIKVYVLLVVVYLWYRFILVFLSDIFGIKKYPDIKAKVSIIVPIYNEKKYLLELCVQSIVKLHNEKEIILVDDHSNEKTREVIKELKEKYPEITALRLKENMGKRYAQYYGMQFATGDYVVTVDSDTILMENSIDELLRPFNNKKIGATTGNVRAFNRERNFLTKMTDARYKNAFTFERRGLSSFGIVTCCSGVISAYKSEVLEEIKDLYVSQKFLGKTCTYGDDRHLTNLFIKKGYKIGYVNEAVAYTEVPTKYSQYIKQQLRWKKSFIRESLYILPYAFKNNRLLAFEVLISLLIPFLSLFSRVVIIYLAFFSPILLLPIFISILIIAFLRNMFLFMEDPKAAIYSIPFAFFYEICIYWLYWIALFTMNDTKWGTR